MKGEARVTSFLLIVLSVVVAWAGECASLGSSPPQEVPATDSIRLLLSRLDLNAPGLEKVHAAEDNPTQAARELLKYFRTRSSVNHPVDRQAKANARGKYATEKDMQTADDALQHILIGQSAYPPHFCGDDIDWSTRPVKDNEWVWQLNRMTFWEAMAHAYWYTGDEKYAREWSAQLIDWVADNPRDEQHAYAWRSIEAGIRGYRWTGLFQHFIDAPSFTPEVLVAFLNSCYEHASFLMDRYSEGSNWALMEAEGMAFIAIIFPEFEASTSWRNEAIRRLNREISNQVYADGQQHELAMGYHVGSIQWFLRTFALASINGQQQAFPASYLTTVERMCEVPMKLGLPDGTNAQFGDAWTGEPGQYAEQFREWAALFDREDFRYLATNGQEGAPPQHTAFALKESGLYSMRSSWTPEATCLVLKCGPDGGFHCQPDNGTFELYAGGRHLMPDAGSYIYSGDPENRAWFRQTKVHQTLTLNGENAAYAPQCRLWQPGEKVDILVVENQSYPDLAHRRAVLFVEKKYIILVDEAIGNARGNVDLHFQLAPGEAIFNTQGRRVQTDFADGWNVWVQTNEQPGLQLEEEEGQVSFVYTKKEPRPAFRYRIHQTKETGTRFVTIVAPYQDTVPEVQARILGNPPIGTSRITVEVTIDGTPQQITYELNTP
ncbi:MAG: alginate lyase family protein [Cyclobacteriaceae bacterium]